LENGFEGYLIGEETNKNEISYFSQNEKPISNLG
jgi:hypothetical protein